MIFMCYMEQDGDDAAGASEEQKSADRGSRQTEGRLGSVQSSWVTLTGYDPHPIRREYSIIHITPNTPALLHTYIHTYICIHTHIYEGSALSRTLQEIAAEEAIRRQHFDAAVARSQQKDTTSTDQVYIHTYIHT